MKKNLIFILYALICSVIISGLYFYRINYELNLDKKMITVFQVGVYKNKVNALSEAKKYNGIVHKDKKNYRVYIAAYQNDEIINKMTDFYDGKGISIYLRKLKANDEYLKIINKYENLLQNSNDKEIYSNLNKLLISKLEDYL